MKPSKSQGNQVKMYDLCIIVSPASYELLGNRASLVQGQFTLLFTVRNCPHTYFTFYIQLFHSEQLWWRRFL